MKNSIGIVSVSKKKNKHFEKANLNRYINE